MSWKHNMRTFSLQCRVHRFISHQASRNFRKMAEVCAIRGKYEPEKRAIASHKIKQDRISRIDGMEWETG